MDRFLSSGTYWTCNVFIISRLFWTWSWRSSSCSNELPFGAHDQILYIYFFLTIALLFFPERPLWREDGSVTYSTISHWSGHWELITTIYRLIWDCVSILSPLTTRRDCGGGILTRLHTGPKPQHIRCYVLVVGYCLTSKVYCVVSTSR
jgi:hypothetical protein